MLRLLCVCSVCKYVMFANTLALTREYCVFSLFSCSFNQLFDPPNLSDRLFTSTVCFFVSSFLSTDFTAPLNELPFLLLLFQEVCVSFSPSSSSSFLPFTPPHSFFHWWSARGHVHTSAFVTSTLTWWTVVPVGLSTFPGASRTARGC